MAFGIPLTLTQVLLVFMIWTGLEMLKIERVYLVDASFWGIILYRGLVRSIIRSLSPHCMKQMLEDYGV